MKFKILLLLSLTFNYAVAQLTISQNGDAINIHNHSSHTQEVFISNSSKKNFLIGPGHSTTITPRKFLSKNSLKKISIASKYSYEAYLNDVRGSFYKMKNNIQIYRSNKRTAQIWMSIGEALNQSDNKYLRGIGKFTESIGITLDGKLDGKSNFEILIDKAKDELIPEPDSKDYFIDGVKAFGSEKYSSSRAIAGSLIYDYFNYKNDPNSDRERRYKTDHYYRVKSFKREYEKGTFKEYGTLKDLGFTIFPDRGGSIKLSALYSLYDDKNDDYKTNHYTPEIAVRINRSRISKNMIIENNLNLGYNIYSYKFRTSDSFSGPKDYLFTDSQYLSGGIDLIIKGGIKRPNIVGLGLEGGSSYNISHTYEIENNTGTNYTDQEEVENMSIDKYRFYYGGFLLIGDRFNAKIGYRKFLNDSNTFKIEDNTIYREHYYLGLGYRF